MAVVVVVVVAMLLQRDPSQTLPSSSIFHEFQRIHDTGFFSSPVQSLEEKFHQVGAYLFLIFLMVSFFWFNSFGLNISYGLFLLVLNFLVYCFGLILLVFILLVQLLIWFKCFFSLNIYFGLFFFWFKYFF